MVHSSVVGACNAHQLLILPHCCVVFVSADCFSIYDLNDDGYISREEMFQMLKTTMVRQPSEEDPDEGIKDLVETMIKRMVWITACIQYYVCNTACCMYTNVMVQLK